MLTKKLHYICKTNKYKDMNTSPVSMSNEVMAVQKSNNSNLYVGLAGTMFVGSDRYAVVITEVISQKEVRVANMEDADYNSNIMIDENTMEYIAPHNMIKYARVNDERTAFRATGDIYKLRKNGRWIKKGHGLWETGAVHFGHVDEYRDPSF